MADGRHRHCAADQARSALSVEASIDAFATMINAIARAEGTARRAMSGRHGVISNLSSRMRARVKKVRFPGDLKATGRPRGGRRLAILGPRYLTIVFFRERRRTVREPILLLLCPVEEASSLRPSVSVSQGSWPRERSSPVEHGSAVVVVGPFL
jgi:hypothetical protein